MLLWLLLFILTSRVECWEDGSDWLNFPLGGASVECPPIAPREIVTSVSTTRGDGRVFAKLLRFPHESTSFLDCVIEGNGRNEGTVHFITYRALHAGRTALIGRISSSLHSINPPDPCSPLIGQNLIAVSSHYMENSMPYLACLPVGGASLANDDVMRGGGAAEIGMWRKQVR